MDLNISIIGYIRNEWNEPMHHQADSIMRSISTIEVKEEYADGLFKIENFSELRTTTHSGDYRGVFACCSPRRPSPIGLTRVTLTERNGNILKVTGLDALNNTPVLDIKPFLDLDHPSA